jgi:mannose-6-phosphate isomerase-like protein (cupin superfamily)
MEKTKALKETGVRVIHPDASDAFDFGGLGVLWKVNAKDTGGHFSIVHHPIAPHALAAPLHYHHNEDELSFVLRGRLGALLGEDVVIANTGSWVFKPREQWHTFWNPDNEPCEIIEIISPAGFEAYFREVAASWGDVNQFAEINRKYNLDMDFDSVPDLCKRFDLTFPEF